jgi:hypothetical protein
MGDRALAGPKGRGGGGGRGQAGAWGRGGRTSRATEQCGTCGRFYLQEVMHFHVEACVEAQYVLAQPVPLEGGELGRAARARALGLASDVIPHLIPPDARFPVSAHSRASFMYVCPGARALPCRWATGAQASRDCGAQHGAGA